MPCTLSWQGASAPLYPLRMGSTSYLSPLPVPARASNQQRSRTQCPLSLTTFSRHVTLLVVLWVADGLLVLLSVAVIMLYDNFH